MSVLMQSAGVLLLILSTAASAQTAQDQLKKARTFVGKNQFAPALKLVDKATSEAGNDLETTLELLELSGICNAALKKAVPARAAFQKLLSLAPTYTLTRKGPPLVLKAFAEAKATAVPLAILPTAPDMSTGRISEIAADVRADAHKLAKTILFSYRVGGGKWKVRAVPAALGRVAAKVDAADKVEWYATVLGANDAELMRIRNVDAPITHTYSAPTASAQPPTTPLQDLPEDAPRKSDPAQPPLTPSDRPAAIEVVEAGRGRAKWVAPTSIALIVAGAAAAGVGTYFGVQAGGARRQFAEATGMGSGVVLGLTRQRALELDSQARGGVIANSLWIAGGALVLTGIAVALFGPDEVSP